MARKMYLSWVNSILLNAMLSGLHQAQLQKAQGYLIVLADDKSDRVTRCPLRYFASLLL